MYVFDSGNTQLTSEKLGLIMYNQQVYISALSCTEREIAVSQWLFSNQFSPFG